MSADFSEVEIIKASKRKMTMVQGKSSLQSEEHLRNRNA
jgi:hypothetical protein